MSGFIGLIAATCSLSPASHYRPSSNGSMNRAAALLLVRWLLQMLFPAVDWSFSEFWIFPVKTRSASQARQNRLGRFHHHAHIRRSDLLALVDAKCCSYYATNITNFPVCIWQILCSLQTEYGTCVWKPGCLYSSAGVALFSAPLATLASRLSSNFFLAVILVLVVMEMTFPMTCPHSVCASEWSWYCSFSQTNGPKLENNINSKPLLC